MSGWPLALFLVVLLLRWGGAWLDPTSLLDNTRQYGPPLVARLDGNAWLAAQPQVQYFADASPRLYQALVEAVAGLLHLPVVPTTKLLAALGLVPLLLLVWALAGCVLKDRWRRVLLALLLAANAIFSNLVLTGTPRDLGTLLLLALLLARLRGSLGWSLLALALLAGCYPTFGILGVLTLLLMELLRHWGPLAAPRPVLVDRWASWCWVGGPSLVAALGLKLLGPRLSAARWGPTFRLFESGHFGGLTLGEPIPARDLGPSVASLMDFQATPRALLALFGDKRFRPLPASGQHAFGWLADPVSLLLLALVVAVGVLAWPPGRGSLDRLRRRVVAHWRQQLEARPDALRLAIALLLAGLLLYGASFALAFRLHDPNRYLMVPALVLLSGVAWGMLSLLMRQRWRRWLPLLLAVLLPLLRQPVDLLPFDQAAAAVVRAQLQPARDQVLLPDGGRPGALAAALPVAAGVRVFYAEELDRGFQRQAIADGLRLRRRQKRLLRALRRGDPGLGAELASARVSHLVVEPAWLKALPERPGCRTPLPPASAGSEAAADHAESLVLVDVACQFDRGGPGGASR